MSSCFVHPPPSIPKELFHSLRWICSSLLLQVNTELTPAARILHYASIREDSEVCVGVGGGGPGESQWTRFDWSHEIFRRRSWFDYSPSRGPLTKAEGTRHAGVSAQQPTLRCDVVIGKSQPTERDGPPVDGVRMTTRTRLTKYPFTTPLMQLRTMILYLSLTLK